MHAHQTLQARMGIEKVYDVYMDGFEFDERKSQSNLAKYGIDLVEAQYSQFGTCEFV
jgi:hypothetical protein